jgi:hypothetical protein
MLDDKNTAAGCCDRYGNADYADIDELKRSWNKQ